METQAYLKTQNEILETHLLVFDFKALSFRFTSVTDKNTINAYFIDQEVYFAWISFFFFFAFAYLPRFIRLRRDAGPALGGDGKVNAEPEKQNVSELVKTRSFPNYLSLQRFKGPGSSIFKYLLALRT